MTTGTLHKDRAALKILARSKLQAIARREGIKANGKSDEIIEQLIRKYPKGVPRKSTPEPFQDGGVRKRMKVQVTAKEDSDNSVTNRKTERQEEKPKSSSTRNVKLVPDMATSAKKGMQSEANHNARVNHQTGPKTKGSVFEDVRYVRQGLTKIVEEGTFITPVLEETEMLLAEAKKIVDEVSQDAKEIVCIAHHVDQDFLKLLKDDRTLWDGTPFMEPGPRKKWMKYLKKSNGERDRLKMKKMIGKDDRKKNSSLSQQGRAWQKEELTGSVPTRSTDRGQKRVLDDEDAGANDPKKRTRHG